MAMSPNTASLPRRKMLGVTEQAAASGTCDPPSCASGTRELLTLALHMGRGRRWPQRWPRKPAACSSRGPARRPRRTQTSPRLARLGVRRQPRPLVYPPPGLACPPGAAAALFCRPPGLQTPGGPGPAPRTRASHSGSRSVLERCSRPCAPLQRGGPTLGTQGGRPRGRVFATPH